MPAAFLLDARLTYDLLTCLGSRCLNRNIRCEYLCVRLKRWVACVRWWAARDLTYEELRLMKKRFSLSMLILALLVAAVVPASAQSSVDPTLLSFVQSAFTNTLAVNSLSVNVTTSTDSSGAGNGTGAVSAALVPIALPAINSPRMPAMTGMFPARPARPRPVGQPRPPKPTARPPTTRPPKKFASSMARRIFATQQFPSGCSSRIRQPTGSMWRRCLSLHREPLAAILRPVRRLPIRFWRRFRSRSMRLA